MLRTAVAALSAWPLRVLAISIGKVALVVVGGACTFGLASAAFWARELAVEESRITLIRNGLIVAFGAWWWFLSYAQRWCLVSMFIGPRRSVWQHARGCWTNARFAATLGATEWSVGAFCVAASSVVGASSLVVVLGATNVVWLVSRGFLGAATAIAVVDPAHSRTALLTSVRALHGYRAASIASRAPIALLAATATATVAQRHGILAVVAVICVDALVVTLDSAVEASWGRWAAPAKLDAEQIASVFR